MNITRGNWRGWKMASWMYWRRRSRKCRQTSEECVHNLSQEKKEKERWKFQEKFVKVLHLLISSYILRWIQQNCQSVRLETSVIGFLGERFI